MPHAHIEAVGIALSQSNRRVWEDAVVSCGLAGALRNNLPAGTVLVPEYVVRPDGERIICDKELTAALAAAARALGHEPCCEPMLTSASIVRGEQRGVWAKRGCASVDMETGHIRAARVAALRVVLDTPQREISEAWLDPRSALFHIECWKQLPWLMRAAPRAARCAALVVARMLENVA